MKGRMIMAQEKETCNVESSCGTCDKSSSCSPEEREAHERERLEKMEAQLEAIEKNMAALG